MVKPNPKQPIRDQETDEDIEEREEDAIADMEARERRRDSTYHTGVDVDLDANAPKQLDRD